MVASNGNNPLTAASILGVTDPAYLYLYTLIIAEARLRSPIVTTISSLPVKLLLLLINESGYRPFTTYGDEYQTNVKANRRKIYSREHS